MLRPTRWTPLRLLRTAASVALGVLALWMLVKWLDWAVFKAVFRPDLAACQALEHHGACWGVVAEKFRPLLLGPLGQGSWAFQDLGGLPLTLVLAALSLGLSLPLGMLLALGRRSHLGWLSWASTAYIELVRGVPLVTLLFMGAFMLPALFPAHLQPSLFVRVSIALTMFSAAYLAEIVRSGLQTVPQEQIEAAQVLGLKSWRIYQLIVLPQALRAVLPALVSHAIGLLKDTSLVMVVSLHELTGSLGLTLGGDPDWRPFYLEGYLFVASIYAAMCLSLGWWGRWMESRWQGAVR